MPESLPASDLGLDPSDPLNLLIHNSPTDSTERADMFTDQASPPDWSQLANLWPSMDDANHTDLIDVADLAPLSIHLDDAMTIEPSALHFDPAKFTPTFEDSFAPHSPDMMLPYPFSFHPSASRSVLSVETTPTSSASASPIPPPASSVPLDPAAELAQRVRESAGVMLAVPAASHLPGYNPLNGTYAHTLSPDEQAKIPIPSLTPSSATGLQGHTSSSPSSAESTPPPTTPPASSDAPSPSSDASPSNAAPASIKSSRPKTSHTTIERRYRNNLNARIQSLRMAVPALRVLEDREAIANVGTVSKKVKVKISANAVIRGIKSECLPGGAPLEGEVDVIDERGFVDGVKVARKCSKANVLGKAVEYIRVLKRREQRLKAEQSGLKSLISGLVGGPALLREWEREWRERFGGEEKDEVEGDADDEDSDDEEEDVEDDTVGKKRKRAKMSAATASGSSSPPASAAPKKEKESTTKTAASAKTSAPLPIGPDGQPEKRKRGRPRKVVPPPLTTVPATSSSPTPAPAAAPPPIVAQPSPLFPELKMDTTPYMPQHESHGQQYMLAVFALFSFFNSPLTPSSSRQGHAHTGSVLNSVPHNDHTLSAVMSWRDYVHVAQLGISAIVLCYILCGWLGVSQRWKTKSQPVCEEDKTQGQQALARKWAEEVLTAQPSDESTQTGLFTQIQLYRSSLSYSPSDLAVVAIASFGGWGRIVGRRVGRKLWTQAQARASTFPSLKGYEKMVLADLKSVDEAFGILVARSTVRASVSGLESESDDPMRVLAQTVVLRKLKGVLRMLFVSVVNGGCESGVSIGDKEELVRVLKELGAVSSSAATNVDGQQVDMGVIGQVLDEVCEWISGAAGTTTVTDEKTKELLERIRGLSSTSTRRSRYEPMDDDSGFEEGFESSEDGDADEEGRMSHVSDDDHDDENEGEREVEDVGGVVENEIKPLLLSLVLYRQLFGERCAVGAGYVFGGGYEIKMMSLELRRALGSRVFDERYGASGANGHEEERRKEMGDSVEDARDRVVDMIVEFERNGRRRV